MDLAMLNIKALEVLGSPTGSGLLLPRVLVPVWSGHSERATLPSCLAALGVPKAERDPLGRWGAEGSDTYVRSYRALVRRLINLFVGKARSQDGYNELDEEDAILDTRRLFERRRVPPQAGEAALRDLMGASKGFFTSVAVMVDGGEELAGEEAKIREAVEAKAPDDEHEEFSFVISMNKRGGRSTLHRRDGCWRARRLCFGSFELVAGPDPPAENLFDHRCRDCWRAVALEKPGADSNRDDSTSTSSTSSSSSEPSGAARAA